MVPITANPVAGYEWEAQQDCSTYPSVYGQWWNTEQCLWSGCFWDQWAED